MEDFYLLSNIVCGRKMRVKANLLHTHPGWKDCPLIPAGNDRRQTECRVCLSEEGIDTSLPGVLCAALEG